ncbi:hypothetical protein NRB_15800 [Novosphingobium sp. 11B]
MADEVGTAAAAGEPSFSGVLKGLDDGSQLKNWGLKFEKELTKVFDQNLGHAKREGQPLAPFQPEPAAKALGRLAVRENGNYRTKFIRPCCKKKPFIWPFCNPKC